MNAQLKAFASNMVRGFDTGTQKISNGQTVKGYKLVNDDEAAVAFIETLGPCSRLEELLSQYVAPPAFLTARELMRDLLNIEDYRSTIYDNIVRVYYTEEFSNA